jgi:hypothetical protein
MKFGSVSVAMKRRVITALFVLSASIGMTAELAVAAVSSDGIRNLALNRVAYASASANFVDRGHMATDGHQSTHWRSKPSKQDPKWIYVDLGAECVVSKVTLTWAEDFTGAHKIQVSTDAAPSPVTGFAENWTDVFSSDKAEGRSQEIPIKSVKARYVRLWCPADSAPQKVVLSEFEIFGTGGPVIQPTAPSSPGKDGKWELNGGWKLVSKTYEEGDAAAISTSGFEDKEWLPATVPGTVLTSYLNNGSIPDPFYGNHNKQVSDWFCRSQWWYRTEVTLPKSYSGKRVWLNLAGINHKADIFVNGTAVGRMEGAFIRGRFDITDKVVADGKNCIAVLIHPIPKPLTPIVKSLTTLGFAPLEPNAPCFVESAGWDWLPTIHDRNIGIWNKVYLNTSDDVTIANPFVITDLPLLPDVSRADLTIKAELRNHTDKPCSGTLRGTIGKTKFEKRLVVGANETLPVVLDKSTCPSLSIKDPKLWWPNGYGEQHLYDFELIFEKDDATVSDVKTSKVGIRKFTYQKKTPLIFFCNGKKIMAKGVNWGMDEGMIRCDRAGFDARVRLEAEMNFTLIRNCLGNVCKDDFYELCDEYGILVWDEFGSNHAARPDNVEMFLANTKDRVLARRNHACVVLWCTANEGGPCKELVDGIPPIVKEFDGTRFFVHSSTQSPPIGPDGSYETYSPRFYFRLANGFRSEIGSPVIPCLESIQRMMPHDKLWPIGEGWGDHDWVYLPWLMRPELKDLAVKTGTVLTGDPQTAFCKLTVNAMDAYGPPTDIEDCCRKSQMVAMETFKAIFEGWNNRLWDDCTGVMLWMSNPPWPSLTWNTYDYYLEPTAAYFGSKKGCEPIHVQWSIVSGEVKVINNTFQ